MSALNNFEILSFLGQGTFGVVKLGQDKKTKEKVAIKIIEKNKILDKEEEMRLIREIEILKKFHHINIIRVKGILNDSKNIYIITEYCEKGELFNLIREKFFLDDKEAAYYFYQLINGLESIHKHGIVHRDLKPENLLITKNNILKIIDFGLSNYYDKNKLLSTPCGSPCYASPEVISGKNYDGTLVDIWNTGIILYVMLCGHLPFNDDIRADLYKKIVKCEMKFPEIFGEDVIDLLKKILVNNPKERISIKEIKKHSFYLKGKKVFFKMNPDLIKRLKKKYSNKIQEKNIDFGRKELKEENYKIKKNGGKKRKIISKSLKVKVNENNLENSQYNSNKIFTEENQKIVKGKLDKQFPFNEKKDDISKTSYIYDSQIQNKKKVKGKIIIKHAQANLPSTKNKSNNEVSKYNTLDNKNKICKKITSGFKKNEGRIINDNNFKDNILNNTCNLDEKILGINLGDILRRNQNGLNKSFIRKIYKSIDILPKKYKNLKSGLKNIKSFSNRIKTKTKTKCFRKSNNDSFNEKINEKKGKIKAVNPINSNIKNEQLSIKTETIKNDSNLISFLPIKYNKTIKEDPEIINKQNNTKIYYKTINNFHFNNTIDNMENKSKIRQSINTNFNIKNKTIINIQNLKGKLNNKNININETTKNYIMSTNESSFVLHKKYLNNNITYQRIFNTKINKNDFPLKSINEMHCIPKNHGNKKGKGLNGYVDINSMREINQKFRSQQSNSFEKKKIYSLKELEPIKINKNVIYSKIQRIIKNKKNKGIYISHIKDRSLENISKTIEGNTKNRNKKKINKKGIEINITEKYNVENGKFNPNFDSNQIYKSFRTTYDTNINSPNISKKNNEPNFINQNNATDFIIKNKSNYIKQINL